LTSTENRLYLYRDTFQSFKADMADDLLRHVFHHGYV
jgi:hypothetical protein